MKTLIVALLVCASWSVQADGQLDLSFAEGQGMRPAIGGNDFRRAGVIVNAPGGGYFVAGDGNFRTDPKQDDFDAYVVKIRDDGDNDVTFGALGFRLLSLNRIANGEERVRDMIVQDDGKVVVVGLIEGFSDNVDVLVARLTQDGSLDPTFSSDGWLAVDFDVGGVLFDAGSWVLQLSDGKLLVGGGIQISAENAACGITRLNANGTRDVTFDVDGRLVAAIDAAPSISCTEAFLLADGRFILAGIAQDGTAPDSAQMIVARLNADGSVDESFGTAGSTLFQVSPDTFDTALGLAVATDGSIYLAGGSNGDMAVVGFDADGFRRSDFGNDGLVLIPLDLGGAQDDFASDLLIDRRGDIVVAGDADGTTTNLPVLIRLRPDGSFDQRFGSNGVMTYPTDAAYGEPGGGTFRSVIEDPQGRYVGAGLASLVTTRRGIVARVLADAIFLNSFE